MPKYYCDYCKSYLTHDTMSVRKSHLIGKNHIKFYCNYYESKAKETGVWNEVNNQDSSQKYEITLDYLNRKAPGSSYDLNAVKDHDELMVDHDTSSKKNDNDEEEEDEDEETLKSFLPPPPNLQGLPVPPPSFYNFQDDYQKSLSKHIKISMANNMSNGL
ncbi:hypothetical protein DFJ63DRAFT_317385 [Scheffersomyces coipomensis]|uniref:uncharacterized protein n=1 Tax=Scheffersomyces coipomensis TaxID=1788519 RepID=UPI00315D33BF